MDLKTKGLDTRYVKDHLTIKTYPKPGYDVYLVRIYYKGAYLAEIEVDGLELEMWRYKDNPDPDSYTYDELEAEHPESWKVVQKPPMSRAERWKQGLPVEEKGWD